MSSVPKITVRKFNENDKEYVNSIEKQASKELTSISSILHYYNIPDDGFRVAEIDSVIVGFIIFNTRIAEDGTKEGHILSIATDGKSKKKGVGRILIEDMVEKMKNVGITRIGLEVKTSNTEAHKFYYKLGFEKLHTIPRYYRMRGYSEDALVLKKNINSTNSNSSTM